MQTVFEHRHYRDYLKERLVTRGPSRGLRTKLAALTRTKPAFITRMLAGDIDLSPEHIPPTNRLLQHTTEESHFFTLLVLKARAGTPELEGYYEEQLREVLRKRSEFLERVEISEKISLPDQALYYSQWYYLAIHVLVGIPQFQERNAIAARLGLPVPIVSRALEELLRMGLVERDKAGRHVMGKKRMHLDKNSPLIAQLHSLFRHRAVHSLAAQDAQDLHFSLGMSVSRALFAEYRARLLDLVTEFEPKIAESKEEEFYAINIDLFRF